MNALDYSAIILTFSISLFILILAFLQIKKYKKTVDLKHSLFAYFLFSGSFGWGLIGLGFLCFNLNMESAGEIFAKMGAGFLNLTAVFSISLFTYFANSDFVGISFFFGVLIFAVSLIAISAEPLLFIDGDIICSAGQKLIFTLNALISTVLGLFFIIYAIKKLKGKLRRKVQFFGFGMLTLTLGTILTTLFENFYISTLFKIMIIVGVLLMYKSV